MRTCRDACCVMSRGQRAVVGTALAARRRCGWLLLKQGKRPQPPSAWELAAPGTASPRRPPTTPPAVVVAVSAGNYYTCAILPSGAARCWGKGQRTPVPKPNDFESVVHTYIESGMDTCYIFSPRGGKLFEE